MTGKLEPPGSALKERILRPIGHRECEKRCLVLYARTIHDWSVTRHARVMRAVWMNGAFGSSYCSAPATTGIINDDVVYKIDVTHVLAERSRTHATLHAELLFCDMSCMVS